MVCPGRLRLVGDPRTLSGLVRTRYDAVMVKAYGMAKASLTMAASTQVRINNRMPSMPSLRMNCDMEGIPGV